MHLKYKTTKTTIPAIKKLGAWWPQILEVPSNYMYHQWQILVSSLMTILYRQGCFLAWSHWESEHGRNWEQKFCIKTVMAPSTQRRLNGLETLSLGSMLWTLWLQITIHEEGSVSWKVLRGALGGTGFSSLNPYEDWVLAGHSAT